MQIFSYSLPKILNLRRQITRQILTEQVTNHLNAIAHYLNLNFLNTQNGKGLLKTSTYLYKSNNIYDWVLIAIKK